MKRKNMKAHDRLPIYYDPISRRMFLRGLGAALSIPFLPSLIPYAEAQTVNDFYYIFAQIDSGRAELGWYPYKGTRPSAVAGFSGVKATSLANISGTLGLGNYLRNTFNDLRGKINIIQGIDAPFCNNTHGVPIYTGGGRNETGDVRYALWSIDSILAASSKVYPTAPKLRVLRLEPKVGGSSISYAGKNQGEVAYGKTVTEVWNLVKSLMTPTTGGPATDVNAGKQKLLVDRFLAEYKTVVNSGQVSGEDKNLIQNVVDHLSDLQKKVGTPTTPPSGGALAACGVDAAVNFTNNDDFNNRLIEIMTLAMACGVTRVGSYHLNWESCMDSNVAISESVYHDPGVHTCHASRSDFDRVANWWNKGLEKYAYMIRRMDQFGLLDRSMIMCAGEFSSSTAGHHGHDMPILTAGTLGGKFQTGQWIDFRTATELNIWAFGGIVRDSAGNYVNDVYETRYGGRHFRELMNSVFAAAGVPPTEYIKGYSDGFGSFNCQAGNTACNAFEDVTTELAKYYKTYTQSPTATLPYLYKG